MTDNNQIKKMFDELRCCIIIPTYNNALTLKKVISEVLEYTKNVIVVNDGSVDETAKIIESFEGLRVIHFTANKGKGYALRKAIKFAFNEGFQYGITIDSDGQHFPSDLPAFLEKIKEEPVAIIIGSRNMKQSSIPGKSSFGNKFSNFWFRIETGKKLPDTQSGYRSYPLFLLQKKHYFGCKYEFEIEVLVRSSWKGIKIIPIPVKVYYPPESERVSHFRPFADFFRISVLNTILVIYALLFIKPFKFVRALNKKNIKEFYRKHIIQNQDSDAKITFSLMVGVFSGITPLWGWQWGIALLLAILFKLNKVIALVTTNISVPPMIPLIIYMSYFFGAFVYKHDLVQLQYSSDLTLEAIKINLLQYLIGSFIFAIIISLCLGLITYILLKIFRKKHTITDFDISELNNPEQNIKNKNEDAQ